MFIEIFTVALVAATVESMPQVYQPTFDFQGQLHFTPVHTEESDFPNRKNLQHNNVKQQHYPENFGHSQQREEVRGYLTESIDNRFDKVPPVYRQNEQIGEAAIQDNTRTIFEIDPTVLGQMVSNKQSVVNAAQQGTRTVTTFDLQNNNAQPNTKPIIQNTNRKDSAVISHVGAQNTESTLNQNDAIFFIDESDINNRKTYTVSSNNSRPSGVHSENSNRSTNLNNTAKSLIEKLYSTIGNKSSNKSAHTNVNTEKVARDDQAANYLKPVDTRQVNNIPNNTSSGVDNEGVRYTTKGVGTSGDTTTTSANTVDVDDRASFDGGSCPTGQVKFAGRCIDVD